MNLFDLFIKLKLDDEASEKAATLASKLGGGLKKAAGIGVAAVGAASTGIIALTKSAVDSYAEYEQLVGGVETLFGAGGKTIDEYAASVGKTVDEVKTEYDALMQAQSTVLANADEAYMNAGISANKYMETVTSFSASLISSLGGDTQAAAEYGNQALIDMSDNANKMGTDMDIIIQTYQSMSRGNFAIYLKSAAWATMQ